MSSVATVQPIRIPGESCPWREGVCLGREVEFTPVGARDLRRDGLAGAFVRQLARRIPSRPRAAEAELDVFTPLGRLYVEMKEFVEIAGPTCQSAEAVAWAYEAAIEALSSVTVEADRQPVVLCHTPSDYNSYTSAGEGSDHSTGCHNNINSPRSLESDEIAAFADIVSPLNAVFGPGGLTWSGGTPRFSYDPRADHVRRLVGRAAHGESPKPFLMQRDEPFARDPNQRLQLTAFGSPRSPVSSWLQAELLTQAFAAVLDGQTPPRRVVDPLQTLRAGPNEPVLLRRGWPTRSRAMSKTELAIATICWLAEYAEKHGRGEGATERAALVRDLSIKAAGAGANGVAQPPVFPTDIAVKRSLFDHVARTCGFADFTDLGRACIRNSARGYVRRALDTIIVTDILFSSPSKHSTYELAHRFGMFVRPEFEHPINLTDLTRLPAGVCPRDRSRAVLLAGKSRRNVVRYCDWAQLIAKDGREIHLPDPWSAWEEPGSEHHATAASRGTWQ